MKMLWTATIAALLAAACGSTDDLTIGSGGADGSGGSAGGGGSGGSTSSSSGGAGGSGGGAASVCTSGTYWLLGDFGSDKMHPGVACLDCHVVGGKAQKRTFDVAGTVYPTAHEPNDCNGVNVVGATVVITDANGVDHSLPVNSAGNFDHMDFFGAAKFPLPIKAKVVYQGKERVMATPQMSGNCNGCHNETGNSGPPGSPGAAAPGRIMLP